MPALMASLEMKQAAQEDVPQKKKTWYGGEYTTQQYFTYLNCQVQDGILKAAFYLPNCLRLDGDHPVYEVYLDKDKINAGNNGRGSMLWWGPAKTWTFEDGVCSSYQYGGNTKKNLIVSFRVLEEAV